MLRTSARFAIALTLAALAACGGSPSVPSVATAPLGDGNFVLVLLGVATACNDLGSDGNPRVGTAIAVSLIATHDAAGTWIAPAASVDGGAFEVRLTRGGNGLDAPGGPARGSDVPVVGTFTGTAVDSASPSPLVFGPTGSSGLFGPGVLFSGVVRSSSGKAADGFTTSTLTFTRIGLSAQCPAGAVEWDLRAS